MDNVIDDFVRIADTETIKFLDLGFCLRPDDPVKIICTYPEDISLIEADIIWIAVLIRISLFW